GWEERLLTSSFSDAVVRQTVITEFASSGKWYALAQYLRGSFEQYPDSWPFYLRALGEQGQIEQMLRALVQIEARLGDKPRDKNIFFCFLMVFAFTGQREPVNWLLDGPLRRIPDSSRGFWRGTAEQTAGDSFAANSFFVPLQQSSHRSISRAVQERRMDPLPVFASKVTTQEQQLLLRTFELFQSAVDEVRGAQKSRPTMTYLLTGLTVVAYGVQLWLSETVSPQYPLQLAALAPELVLHFDQWWRLVGCLFLHGSFTHLFMNCLGLLILGNYVEKTFRGLLFLLIYFGCGIGSSLIVVFLFSAGLISTQVLIGASGAVLGLVGVNAAILAEQYIHHRKAETGQELRAIGFIVVLQVLFDLSTEQVSF
ncbi:MAG: rhomboid family intramembrane serine protease, partial [Bdellovibrionales bacterium]|nr:rhomboid family intramembrane serine protease [Bdellovibrionales bacterium]